MIRIVLVDDHPVVRAGLRALVDGQEDLCVVGEASGLDQAVAVVTADRPDVVLMDLSLGDGEAGGAEVTAALRALSTPPEVLVLTTYDTESDILRALEAGARGYLLKDEPAQEILAAIDSVMTGRNYFSAAVSLRLSQASAPATLLTQRERDVLRHIASGHANKQIAQALGLSVRTVETHRLNIKRKLGIDGQAELIKYAVENRGV